MSNSLHQSAAFLGTVRGGAHNAASPTPFYELRFVVEKAPMKKL
jgi:hypothetical protein